VAKLRTSKCVWVGRLLRLSTIHGGLGTGQKHGLRIAIGRGENHPAPSDPGKSSSSISSLGLLHCETKHTDGNPSRQSLAISICLAASPPPAASASSHASPPLAGTPLALSASSTTAAPLCMEEDARRRCGDPIRIGVKPGPGRDKATYSSCSGEPLACKMEPMKLQWASGRR
jgi:hypothetical protein